MEIDNFAVLPDENLVHICFFVDEDVKTLNTLRLVSKKWFNISNTIICGKLKMVAGADLQSLFEAKWLTNEDRSSFFYSNAKNALNMLPEGWQQWALPLRVRALFRRTQVAQHIKRKIFSRPRVKNVMHDLFRRCLANRKNGALKQKAQRQLRTLVIIGLNPKWHIFAENKQEREISECLEAGGNIDAKDQEGETALHQAVERDRADAISLLLKKGANVNVQDKDGRTPLHYAAEDGDHDTISELLKAKINLDLQDKARKTALHRAVSWGNTGAVSDLLKAKANTDVQDKDGKTALHRAISWDNISAVSDLLKAKANTDVQDKDGWTPLHHAVNKGNANMLSKLLKARADIEVQDKDGYTALLYAELFKPDLVLLLKNAKTKIASRNKG